MKNTTSLELANNVDTLASKVGTHSQFTRHAVPRPRKRNFNYIGRSLAAEHERGRNQVLVISGAIAAGRIALNGSVEAGTSTVEKQALASMGQYLQIQRWRQSVGMRVAQILLTSQDLATESRRTEALSTIYQDMSWDTLPIVNENDSTTHEEITFGDNDGLTNKLAIRMQEATIFGRMGVVFFIEKAGLLEDKDRASSRIKIVDDIDVIRELVVEDEDDSNGGMGSKLDATEGLLAAGIPVWFAPSFVAQGLERTLAGEAGTLFVPEDVVA